jgi:hypothetical protein
LIENGNCSKSQAANQSRTLKKYRAYLIWVGLDVAAVVTPLATTV